MLYNYGVAKALGESDVIDISASELLGASGGALTAIGLVLGLNFDEIAELALQCVGRCHGSVSGAFDLRAYLTEVLDHQFKAFGEQQPSSKYGAGKSVKTKRSTLAAKVLEDNEEEEVSSVASPVLSDASDESRYFSADDDAPNLVDGGAGDGCDGNTDMDKGDDDKDDDKDDDEFGWDSFDESRIDSRYCESRCCSSISSNWFQLFVEKKTVSHKTWVKEFICHRRVEV